MKNFIIYLQPRENENEIVESEYSLDDLKKFPGTSQLPELELVRNGKLKIINELEPHRIFQFSCDFLIRLVAAAKPVTAQLSFEVWQRKHGPIVATFEGRKKASKIAVALLSLILYGDPFSITPIKLTVSDFRNLKTNILEKHSGILNQILLRNIHTQKGKINRFLMTGPSLKEFEDIDDLLDNASSVSGMGFAIPSFEGERRFSFRIKDWGGGQIYSPANPLVHEVSNLLELLEEALFSNL